LAFCHVATVFYQQVSVSRSTVVSGHRPSFCMLCPFYPAAALPGHCCKVSDEAAFCLIQRPYISKTLLTRRISPRGSP
ncbi:hypothetical protein, partial [Escherichia coli]|uniref:hypothetical protein n=1 Tax=Escherichia coli TaxID=562 RepID=UPI001ABB7CF6